MIYLKLFENFTSITLNTGQILFHASSENFDVKNIKTSAYDDILWTAEDSGIAQMYIPVSGSTIYIDTKNVYKIPEKGNPNMFKNIGIDYKNITYDQYNRPSSWITNIDGFKEINDEYYDLRDKYYNIKAKIKDIIDKGNIDKSVLYSLISDETKTENEFNNFNIDKKKNDIINKKLEDYGYVPYMKDDYTHNHSWKLKISDNKLLKSDFRLKGRLFILELLRDFKIYDYASGREGDLTNLDYHKLNLFRKLESKGYDGIKIHDFAQSESEGNFGHTSIGLFKHTIKDLKFTVIDNVEHPTEKDVERMFKTKDWRSKEFIMKNKSNN